MILRFHSLLQIIFKKCVNDVNLFKSCVTLSRTFWMTFVQGRETGQNDHPLPVLSSSERHPASASANYGMSVQVIKMRVAGINIMNDQFNNSPGMNVIYLKEIIVLRHEQVIVKINAELPN